MKESFCFLTNDVETTSLLRHELNDETGKLVLTQGMPRLLDLFDQYNIKTTFFYTGYIAKLYPDVVKIAHARGHEIASHGYSHKSTEAFDVLKNNEVNAHLSLSKNILENIIGEEVISFRAPALRVRKDITNNLIEAGFKIDSSVASQRFDMFFSFGSKHKFNWFYAPRSPYFASKSNIFRKGNSQLLEIPITAHLIPYIGTTMRISPILFKSMRPLILMEKKLFNRHLNFLSHPNEFIDEKTDSKEKIKSRSRNPLSFFLKDYLRHKVKLKNLGGKALPLLQNEIEFMKRRQYTFYRMKDIYEILKKQNAS